MNINKIKIFIEEKHKILMVLLFVIFFFIGLIVFQDYGISWDEAIQRSIGIVNAEYIVGNNNDLLSYIWKYNGPAFELLLVTIEDFFNLTDSKDIFSMRHLANFLVFYLSVIFFYLLCKHRFNSWKVGLLGSLFLILSPRIFAHSFYNSKDIPALSIFIISIYTLIRYLDKKNILRGAIHALTCSILIDIRILGIIVPFFTYIFVIFDLSINRKVKARIGQTVKSVLIFTVLLCFFTVLFFPILWKKPFSNFIDAFNFMKLFPWYGSVLYLGNRIKATNLPWHYIPVWLLITTPIVYSFTFFIALFTSIKSILKSPLKFYSNEQNRNDLIFLSWLFLPVIMVIAFKSVLYDGWRHLYFIYPAFIITSLKGLIYLFESLKSKFKGQILEKANIILILVVAFNLIATALFMIKNHPYQNVYFNKLAGRNMEQIKMRFELDYWGLSYRKALEYIVKNDTNRVITVLAANYPGKLNAKMLPYDERRRLVFVKKLGDAKYFISNYRDHPQEYPYKDELYSIKIGGTKIMVVYKLI